MQKIDKIKIIQLNKSHKDHILTILFYVRNKYVKWTETTTKYEIKSIKSSDFETVFFCCIMFLTHVASHYQTGATVQNDS